MDTSKFNLMLNELFGLQMEDRLFIVEQMITTVNKNKEKQLQDLVKKHLKENQF